VPRARAFRGAAHRRSRSAQKSRTARKTTCGLAPVDPPAPRAQLDQELRREERAAGFNRHALERAPGEQLAGTVDVADLEPEEEPVGEPVGTRVQGSNEGVGASNAVPDDRVGGARLEPLDKAPEIDDLELAVTVRVRKMVEAGGGEPGPERGTVAEVGRVVDGANRWVRRGQRVRQRRRRVPGAIVDDDDLERLGERRQRRQGLSHERLEVGGLVVGREEVRQGGQSLPRFGGGARDWRGRRRDRRGHLAAANRPLTFHTAVLPPLATTVMSNWLVSSSVSPPARRIT
jgi:hypothetical protein